MYCILSEIYLIIYSYIGALYKLLVLASAKTLPHFVRMPLKFIQIYRTLVVSATVLCILFIHGNTRLISSTMYFKKML